MMPNVFVWPTIGLLLCSFACAAAEPFHPVACEGAYPKHLQGVCTNERDAIYWSFTTTLVKTDVDGHVTQKVRVADHHGDLCFHHGMLYVAVNLGQFNQPAGKEDSWVYVYDGDTLQEMAKHKVPELVHGAGGIAFHDGRFYVVGGLPPGAKENYVYEYDASFVFQKRHVVNSGYTLMGIQTIAHSADCWWLGCYGNPRVLVKADQTFSTLGKWNFDASLGLIPLTDGRFLVASGKLALGSGYSARLRLAVPDEKSGLRFVDEATPK